MSILTTPATPLVAFPAHVALSKDSTLFEQKIDGVEYRNTAYRVDQSNGDWLQDAILVGMLPTLGQLEFGKIKTEFDQAVAKGMNRFAYQLQGSALTLNKMPDGLWSIAAHKDAGVAGVSYGYCQVVNDSANPLFVGNDLKPIDPSRYVSSYNLIRENYLRLVDGASAIIEMLTPMKFRSFELITYAQTSGYILPDLEVLTTYDDGATELSISRAYNAGYYLSNCFDQTKAIRTIKMTYKAANAIGQPSMLCSDGVNIFPYSTTSGVPLLRISYLYGYQQHFIEERFYPKEADLVDQTSLFTLTSNIAQAAAFPLSNLTDGNDATMFKPSTNAATLTITATKTAATPNIYPQIVELTIPVDAANGNNTLQSIVSALSLSTGAGNLAGNTRWYRLSNAVVIKLLVGMPNTMSEISDKITLAFTKTSTTQPFAISSLRILGF